MKKAPIAKAPAKKSQKFTVTLTIGNQTGTSTGASMEEAMMGLVAPPKTSAKGVIAAAYGEQHSSMYLYPAQLRRFLANPLSRQLVAKRLLIALS